MSTRPDQERSITEWLVAEASDRAPDRLLEASRERVRTTRQRRAWWPAWRIPEMNNTVRLVVAAAAVVVVALLGYQLLIAPNVGGPAPSVSPSTAPSEAATLEPTLSGPVSFTDHEGEGRELEPGQYFIDYASPVVVTITVPPEVFEGYPTAWYKALFDWGPWHQSNAARLGFGIVENVYVDPCDASALLDPAVGPTVDDLVTALGSVPGLIVSSSSAVTLDGYSGQLMELTGGERPADCVEDPVVWETTGGQPSFLLPSTGDRARVWILDVAGNRLVAWAIEDAGTSDPDSVRASLQALVDSIQVEVP